MSAFLPQHRLSYISVPKVACTSVKHVFYQAENGQTFKPFQANGVQRHIHHLYPGYRFDQLPHDRIAGHHRVAVVRDPLQRLLSCYSNRVVFHRCLSEEKVGPALAVAGLTCDPDLGEFLDRFDEYRAVSGEVSHHSNPLIHSLGEDPAFYGKIYAISQLAEFVSDINTRLGKDLKIGHSQAGGPKLQVADMSEAHRARFTERFAADYRIYGRYL